MNRPVPNRVVGKTMFAFRVGESASGPDCLVRASCNTPVELLSAASPTCFSPAVRQCAGEGKVYRYSGRPPAICEDGSHPKDVRREVNE